MWRTRVLAGMRLPVVLQLRDQARACVLALILIVRNTRTLLLTVTAFTVAYSITLSLATLGVVHVPGAPVEACIALSILLVASEIARLQQGEQSLTATRP